MKSQHYANLLNSINQRFNIEPTGPKPNIETLRAVIRGEKVPAKVQDSTNLGDGFDAFVLETRTAIQAAQERILKFRQSESESTIGPPTIHIERINKTRINFLGKNLTTKNQNRPYTMLT